MMALLSNRCRNKSTQVWRLKAPRVYHLAVPEGRNPGVGRAVSISGDLVVVAGGRLCFLPFSSFPQASAHGRVRLHSQRVFPALRHLTSPAAPSPTLTDAGDHAGLAPVPQGNLPVLKSAGYQPEFRLQP